jgi:prepilin-type N-terminal cleavage/methylation domain-containing protein
MSRKTISGAMSLQRGFTLFEIVVVILLIGVLMTMAIDRMLQLQVIAEKVSVQQMIGNLQGAVNLQAAELIVDKGLDSVRSLAGTNPMQYLQVPPANYIGLKDDNNAAQLPQESWYFDTKQNILVYTVKNTDYFETTLVGAPRIRLRVELIFKDNNGRGAGQVRGINVNSLDEYRWKFNQG